MYLFIEFPDLTSEKIKTPRILYMYNINTVSAETFSRLGRDIIIVSNIFYMPSKFLETTFKSLTTLIILSTLPS